MKADGQPLTRRNALGAVVGTALCASINPVMAASPPIDTGSRLSTDIVDAQVHIGREGVDSLIATMDALGIGAALLYEHWGMSADRDPRHHPPGYILPNRAWRAATPTATRACLAYPTRFGNVVKVDRRDPHLQPLLEYLRSTPHVRAIRLLPVWTREEAAAFSNGAYDPLFRTAEALQLPMFLFIPGHVEALPRYLAKFPRMTAIVDHIGMPFPGLSPNGPDNSPERTARYFDEVLKLASYPNVALKWSHASQLLPPAAQPASASSFLRRALDSFGADRIMWGSDHTMIPDGHWLGILDEITKDPGCSKVELQHMLGATVRKLLRW